MCLPFNQKIHISKIILIKMVLLKYMSKKARCSQNNKWMKQVRNK